MTCDQLHEYLRGETLPLAEREQALADELFEHLARCAVCRRDWHDLQRRSAAWKRLTASAPSQGPGASSGPHLDSERIWELADHDGPTLTSEHRASWRHALGCEECLGLIFHLADAPAPMSPHPGAGVFERAWTNFVGARVTIACVWLGAALQLGGGGRLGTARRDVARGDETATVVDLPCGNRLARLWIDVVRGAPQTAALEVTLERGGDSRDLRAELYRDHLHVQSRPLISHSAELTAAGAGRYRLEITDRDGGILCAADIDFKVMPDASSPCP